MSDAKILAIGIVVVVSVLSTFMYWTEGYRQERRAQREAWCEERVGPHCWYTRTGGWGPAPICQCPDGRTVLMP